MKQILRLALFMAGMATAALAWSAPLTLEDVA
jgi:hypothetical protein